MGMAFSYEAEKAIFLTPCWRRNLIKQFDWRSFPDLLDNSAKFFIRLVGRTYK